MSDSYDNLLSVVTKELKKQRRYSEHYSLTKENSY